jgi:hypothetical protein
MWWETLGRLFSLRQAVQRRWAMDQQELDDLELETQQNLISSPEKAREFFWEEGIIDSHGSLRKPYASAVYENAGFYSKRHHR